MQDKITPRPWKYDFFRGEVHNGSDCVCRITWSEDAAHIVHCVNNHEALLEALEGAKVFMQTNKCGGFSMTDGQPVVEAGSAYQKVLKALNQAEL